VPALLVGKLRVELLVVRLKVNAASIRFVVAGAVVRGTHRVMRAGKRRRSICNAEAVERIRRRAPAGEGHGKS
jgi:hypothetical protein